MKVFKFGGASLKDAAAIRNTCKIIQQSSTDNLLVVVSAMGKTTNALEKILNTVQIGQDAGPLIESVQKGHVEIVASLFPSPDHIAVAIQSLFDELQEHLKSNAPYDRKYDQVVATGELLSSLIVSSYLQHLDQPVLLIDARSYIKTDACYREGKVDWKVSEERIRSLGPVLEDKIIVTQGQFKLPQAFNKSS